MSDQYSTKIGKFPILTLLVSQLELIDREHGTAHGSGSDEESQALYARHWDVRAAINAVVARSVEELRAKEKAFQIALASDPDFECDVAGSARELGKSLIADAMAFVMGDAA